MWNNKNTEIQYHSVSFSSPSLSINEDDAKRNNGIINLYYHTFIRKKKHKTNNIIIKRIESKHRTKESTKISKKLPKNV